MLDLSQVTELVLDEADEMLKAGFEDKVRDIYLKLTNGSAPTLSSLDGVGCAKHSRNYGAIATRS